MQTNFTAEQLRQPDIAAANAELRKCVHCGFCMATCPTYLVSGDELEAPRGRIYLAKVLLEEGNDAPDPGVLAHLDRCLTCLSCTTTCPSGVGYDRLIAIARVRTADANTRPPLKRLARKLLLATATAPARLRPLARLGRLAAPLALPLLRGRDQWRPFAAMLEMTRQSPAKRPLFGDYPPLADGPGEGRRAALLTGCAQSVFGRAISEATLHVLRMAGFHVVIPKAAGCCGAMEEHLGERERAKRRAAANVRAWKEARAELVVIDASGCAGTVKEYGALLKDDPALAADAAQLAENAFELSELLATLADDLPWRAPKNVMLMWHAPCSLTHHLRIADLPRRLLERAGFQVLTPAEAHLCCGAGGANAVLEPDVAERLRARKLGHLQQPGVDAIVSANFGCIRHLAAEAALPVLHHAQLLAWAASGPDPFLNPQAPSVPHGAGQRACASGACACGS